MRYFELQPDYRVLLLASTASRRGPVMMAVRRRFSPRRPPCCDSENNRCEEEPHIASWRTAYRAFGAKPQRTRNSLEALLRRAPAGLPRVNRLTDLYNAISVIHQIPLGGEDLARYAGPPRLVRATGEESFTTPPATVPN